MRQQPLDLAVEHLQVGEVHQADGAPADLVLIGRADAAAGGADAPLPEAFSRATSSSWCSGRISVAFSAMRRLSRRHGDALGLQPLDLVDQRVRVEHHAVADHRKLVRPHHAGRQQRQLVGDAVDDKRMAGVVAALEANDDIGLLRQPIDDLALAFVAPLRADHHHIRHSEPFPQEPPAVPGAGGIPATALSPIPEHGSISDSRPRQGGPAVPPVSTGRFRMIFQGITSAL